MFILKSAHLECIRYLESLFHSFLESGADLCKENVRLGVENEQLKAELDELRPVRAPHPFKGKKKGQKTDNYEVVHILLKTFRDTVANKDQECRMKRLMQWIEVHIDLSDAALRSQIARVIQGEKLMERTRRGYYKFL